jgi:putative flippase GtrA
MPHTCIQFIRYALVGATGTVTHYAVLMAAVIGLGAAPVAASSAGAAIGAVVNYLLNYRFTFDSSKRHAEAAVKFAVVAAAGVLLNSAMLSATLYLAGVHYLMAQVVATAAVLMFGFVANRLWTFRSQPHVRS